MGLNLWTAEALPPYQFDEGRQAVWFDAPGNVLATDRFKVHKKILHGIADRMRAGKNYRSFNKLVGHLSCYFRFEESAAPWESHADVKSGISIEISLPVECAAYDRDQLDSLFSRSLDAALQDLFPELPRLDALQVAPVPVELVYLSGLPRSGGGGVRWHRDKDIDAFAKAARVVGDLLERPVQECHIVSDWPMLELAPRLDAPEEAVATSEGRTYEYGVPQGFHDWEPSLRSRYLLRAYGAALEAVAATLARGLGEALGSMIRSVEETGFVYRWRTGILEIRSDTITWAEYISDADGGRVRLVVQEAGSVRTSPWTPAGCGARAIKTVTPIQDLEPWRRGARVRIPDRRGWIAVE